MNSVSDISLPSTCSAAATVRASALGSRLPCRNLRNASAHALPAILREAQLRTVRVPEKAGAAGKLIGELALRTRTGASIVGIQRDEASLINPGPDEELRAGDDVLLLGNQGHLDSAQKLLNDDPHA